MFWFHVLYPAFMLLCPALFLGLWCYLTGVNGMRPILVATLVAVSAFALCVLLLPSVVTANFLFVQAWGMGGFFALLWGYGIPVIRRAVAELPDAPRVVSLRPRKVDLSRGALVLPFVAWLLLAASLLFAPQRSWLIWIGPAVGLIGLLVLRRVLPYVVQEPEPSGGSDPEGLARRQAEFRRTRTHTMYWMMVLLNLLCTAMGWLGGEAGAWIGAGAGCSIGIWGAAFGTWADARRYLLRKELATATEASSPA